jgi:hypothetical protein
LGLTAIARTSCSASRNRDGQRPPNSKERLSRGIGLPAYRLAHKQRRRPSCPFQRGRCWCPGLQPSLSRTECSSPVRSANTPGAKPLSGRRSGR